MTIIITSTILAVYLAAGFFNWLITAVEMLGDTSGNSYLRRLNTFSKLNVVAEVATFAYLTIGWPLHQLLKAMFKE